MSAVLPQYVRQAIVEEFGTSSDLFWKATHDAEELMTEYHLVPEQWTEEAFGRMASARGWTPSTRNHRWYIFRRLLRRLGESRSAVEARPLAPGAARERVPDTTGAAAPSQSRGEPLNLSLKASIRWVPVYCEESVVYSYPDRVTQYMRRRYTRPGVYRWLVLSPGSTAAPQAYVGEAEDLAQRLYQYLHPGPLQQTNLRLKSLLNAARRQGKQVRLELLEIDSVAVAGWKVSANDLGSKFFRRFVENLLTIYHEKAGFSLLNA